MECGLETVIVRRIYPHSKRDSLRRSQSLNDCIYKAYLGAVHCYIIIPRLHTTVDITRAGMLDLAFTGILDWLFGGRQGFVVFGRGFINGWGPHRYLGYLDTMLELEASLAERIYGCICGTGSRISNQVH